MIEIVGADVHLQIEIPRAAFAVPGLALPCKPQLLSIGQARRDRDFHRVAGQIRTAVGIVLRAAQLERARAAATRPPEANVHARMMIAAPARTALPSLREPARAAKQRGEEVAELLVHFGTGAPLRPAAKFEAARPIRRRPEFLATLHLIAELVVGSALLWIPQNLIGLLDFLEFRFRVRFLANVRMVLARKPAIDLFDLIGARAALHAQCLIIISKFHASIPKVFLIVA